MFKVGQKVYCKSMEKNLIVADWVPENKDVLCIDLSTEGTLWFATYWIKESDLEYCWRNNLW